MRMASLYIMAGAYILAGILHFVRPAGYVRIMPDCLPFPMLLVYLSGVAEIIGGLLLLGDSTRVIGAWWIVLLLIAVFPANVQMMMNYYREHSPYLWLTIVRLPLQLVLIWWAWRFTS